MPGKIKSVVEIFIELVIWNYFHLKQCPQTKLSRGKNDAKN